MNPVRIALIGAGNRGRGVFGGYALQHPTRAQFVAVIEPNEAKRNAFGVEHGIPEAQRYSDYREFYAARRKVDAVIIATVENERVDPVMMDMEHGYHLLVEKPLATSRADTELICHAADGYDKVFMVCHQMRYTPLYGTLMSLVASGDYGEVVSIEHSENLSYHHMAHSFVRGLFNSSKLTPMILAKSCHDMDLLRWLAGSRPSRVASFGKLSYFKPENAPEGATPFCLDGCPAESVCPYSAQKIYLGEEPDPAYIRQMGSPETRHELIELLKTNQFGRCVYHCDNDVVDHQSVSLEFQNGVTASFMMTGHNAVERRITKISMTNGELQLDASEGTIDAWSFLPLSKQTITPSESGTSHLGGDTAIMDGFTQAIGSGNFKDVLTPVEMSLDSHLMAFAAEEARLTHQVVEFD
ncbi:MAG: Gfo/Idh/MocA family protein [Armatimonadota bacterium]